MFLFSLLIKYLLDDHGQSFACPFLHFLFEPGKHRYIDLIFDFFLLGNAVRFGKRMHPVPILIVMKIAVDVGFVAVMLRTFFGVACSLLVAKGRRDVVAIVVI